MQSHPTQVLFMDYVKKNFSELYNEFESKCSKRVISSGSVTKRFINHIYHSIGMANIDPDTLNTILSNVPKKDVLIRLYYGLHTLERKRIGSYGLKDITIDINEHKKFFNAMKYPVLPLKDLRIFVFLTFLSFGRSYKAAETFYKEIEALRRKRYHDFIDSYPYFVKKNGEDEDSATVIEKYSNKLSQKHYRTDQMMIPILTSTINPTNDFSNWKDELSEEEQQYLSSGLSIDKLEKELDRELSYKLDYYLTEPYPEYEELCTIDLFSKVSHTSYDVFRRVLEISWNIEKASEKGPDEEHAETLNPKRNPRECFLWQPTEKQLNNDIIEKYNSYFKNLCLNASHYISLKVKTKEVTKDKSKKKSEPKPLKNYILLYEKDLNKSCIKIKNRNIVCFYILTMQGQLSEEAYILFCKNVYPSWKKGNNFLKMLDHLLTPERELIIIIGLKRIDEILKDEIPYIFNTLDSEEFEQMFSQTINTKCFLGFPNENTVENDDENIIIPPFAAFEPKNSAFDIFILNAYKYHIRHSFSLEKEEFTNDIYADLNDFIIKEYSNTYL